MDRDFDYAKGRANATNSIETSKENKTDSFCGVVDQGPCSPNNYLLEYLKPNNLSNNSTATHDTRGTVANNENDSIRSYDNSSTRNKEDTTFDYSARSVLRDINESWSSKSYALKYFDGNKNTSDINNLNADANSGKKSDCGSAASSLPPREIGKESSSDKAAKNQKLDKLSTNWKFSITKHSDSNLANNIESDDVFPPPGCVCLRAASKIRCNACGYTFIGRIYENCEIHGNMGVMLGASYCIMCVANSRWLEKIPCDDEDLFFD